MRKILIISIIVLTILSFVYCLAVKTAYDSRLKDNGQTFGATVCMPYQGCTGTSTPPTYGKLLVGNAGGTYTLTATSSLGINTDNLVQGSSNLFNQTHTGDVTGATALTIGADKVNDTHIDWGTGANQVSTADVPEQTNLYFTSARSDARINATSSIDTLLQLLRLTNASTTQLTVSGPIYDKDGQPGTSGQVLSSTGTQLDWVAVGAGTVTSVGLAVPIGLSVSGTNPITSSGTLTLAYNIKSTFIPFGGASNEMATSTGLYFTSSRNELTITNASTTALSATNLYGTLTGTASGNLTSASIDTIAELNAILTGEDVASTSASMTALSDATWTLHNSYPAACGANTWTTTIGDTLTCSAITYAGITAMTSANFAGLINDETGTAGKVVFDTSPTLITPILGYASSTQLTVSGSTYLAATGSVGVGTTTPSAAYKLDTYGPFRNDTGASATSTIQGQFEQCNQTKTHCCYLIFGTSTTTSICN